MHAPANAAPGTIVPVERRGAFDVPASPHYSLRTTPAPRRRVVAPSFGRTARPRPVSDVDVRVAWAAAAAAVGATAEAKAAPAPLPAPPAAPPPANECRALLCRPPGPVADGGTMAWLQDDGVRGRVIVDGIEYWACVAVEITPVKQFGHIPMYRHEGCCNKAPLNAPSLGFYETANGEWACSHCSVVHPHVVAPAQRLRDVGHYEGYDADKGASRRCHEPLEVRPSVPVLLGANFHNRRSDEEFHAYSQQHAAELDEKQRQAHARRLAAGETADDVRRNPTNRNDLVFAARDADRAQRLRFSRTLAVLRALAFADDEYDDVRHPLWPTLGLVDRPLLLASDLPQVEGLLYALLRDSEKFQKRCARFGNCAVDAAVIVRLFYFDERIGGAMETMTQQKYDQHSFLCLDDEGTAIAQLGLKPEDLTWDAIMAVISTLEGRPVPAPRKHRVMKQHLAAQDRVDQATHGIESELKTFAVGGALSYPSTDRRLILRIIADVEHRLSWQWSKAQRAELAANNLHARRLKLPRTLKDSVRWCAAPKFTSHLANGGPPPPPPPPPDPLDAMLECVDAEAGVLQVRQTPDKMVAPSPQWAPRFSGTAKALNVPPRPSEWTAHLEASRKAARTAAAQRKREREHPTRLEAERRAAARGDRPAFGGAVEVAAEDLEAWEDPDADSDDELAAAVAAEEAQRERDAKAKPAPVRLAVTQGTADASAPATHHSSDDLEQQELDALGEAGFGATRKFSLARTRVDWRAAAAASQRELAELHGVTEREWTAARRAKEREAQRIRQEAERAAAAARRAADAEEKEARRQARSRRAATHAAQTAADAAHSAIDMTATEM